MPPNTPSSILATTVLPRVIHYHLDNYFYGNALFFAERLAAQDPKSPESTYLLALCHFKLEDFRTAFETAKPAAYKGVHLGCIWIFAQSCHALQKYKDGIHVLEKSRPLWPVAARVGKHTSSDRISSPDSSAALCLLGKLYREQNDIGKAVQCFEDSLKSNPFMWDAFTILCDMGVSLRVPRVFSLPDSFAKSFVDSPSFLTTEISGNGPDPQNRKLVARVVKVGKDAPVSHSDSPTPKASRHFTPQRAERLVSMVDDLTGSGQTPAATALTPGTGEDNAPNDRPRTPTAPPKRMLGPPTEPATAAVPPRESAKAGNRKVTARRNRVQQQQDTQDAVQQATGPTIPGNDRKRSLTGHPVQNPSSQPQSLDPPLRRSTRLAVFNNPGPREDDPKRVKRVKRLPSGTEPLASHVVDSPRHGFTVAVNRTRLATNSKAEAAHPGSPRVEGSHQRAWNARKLMSETSKLDACLKWVCDLLVILGTGYHHLSHFRCQEAVKAYEQLPQVQQETPSVLGLMGRAYFEQAAYAKAERLFRRLRETAPTRLEDMEVYSTVLWHLNKSIELTFLAQELLGLTWRSPQA